jgi:protein-S-isoprenylcysteine O-methyltransferase Ste14
MTDLPLAILICTVCAYWLGVVIMAVRQRAKYGRSAGTFPRLTRERLMWFLWGPNVIAWIVLPIQAAQSSHWLLALPAAAQDPAILAVRWAAALLGVSALAVTIPCWLTMGEGWSMAVVPGRKTPLVTNGMFALSRNPIYSLNSLLVVSSAVVVMTPPMFLVAVVHLLLVHDKVQSEERHLQRVHGPAYDAYCRETSRYLPWLYLRRLW